MADRSSIEWTDATWNPVRGCTRISDGCRNCYAEGIAARFSDPGQPFHGFAHRTASGPRWTGKLALVPEALAAPLRWRKPRRIFVNSMSDLFHESLPDEVIEAVFAVMSLAPQHTFQVLTKRADRMRSFMEFASLDRCQAELCAAELVPVELIARARKDTINGPWPLPHVQLGVSAEDQRTAEERIPHLLRTRAAVRILSAEPLLGPIDLRRLRVPGELYTLNALTGLHGVEVERQRAPGGDLRDGLAELPRLPRPIPALDWVIAGGESGRGARPAHPDWFRRLRDDCATTRTPFFFKQHGAWKHMPERAHFKEGFRQPWMRVESQLPGARPALMFQIGHAAAGAELDGRLHQEFPPR
jgi:protein gp37